MQGLKRKLINITKPFYDNVDPEHGFKHIETVLKNALYIYNRLDDETKSQIDYKLIYYAVYLHDIFSGIDRVNHHTKAKEWVYKNRELLELTICETMDVAMAVGEHRASYKGTFFGPLSELLSSADRGEPILEDIIKRIYGTCMDRNTVYERAERDFVDKTKLTNDELHSLAIKDTLHHLHDKYGSNGYAKYPDMYKKVYGNELKQMQDVISKKFTTEKFIVDLVIYNRIYAGEEYCKKLMRRGRDNHGEKRF